MLLLEKCAPRLPLSANSVSGCAMLHRRMLLAFVCLFLAAPATAAPKKRGQKKDEFPKFDAVKLTVQRSLKELRGYRPGDLLTQRDIERALKAVGRLGWKVADQKAIVAAALPENDYLVRQLRAGNGVRFMRKLSGNAANYDRLDRLRRLKYGERRIPELIANPGGYTLILYMTGTRSGRTLGRMLNRVPGGRNFNKPTNRIYTEEQLLKRLKAGYDAEVKARSKQQNKKKKKEKKKPAGKPPGRKPAV